MRKRSFILLMLWASFTIDAAAQSAPTLSSPANGAVDQPVTLTLRWNSVLFALSYDLQVATTADFSNLVVNTSTTLETSKSVGPLSSSTKYYWRVRAVLLASTTAWSSVWNFSTISSAPRVPTLVSPPDGATNIPSTTTLSWSISLPAQSYHLQVSTSASFAQLTVDEANITSTSKQVSGLAANAKYYWRVNASNSGGTSAWSLVWSFTTALTAPGAPKLLSPPDNAIDQPTAIMLRWNSISGATSYGLQVAAESTFSSPLIDQSPVNDTSRQVNGLVPSTQYFWRVNAHNSAGTSDWSPVWAFTTRPESTAMITLNATIEFPERTDPTQYLQTDYKIVGLPGASNSPASNVIPGTPRVGWQLYWDNGAPSNYLVAYDGGTIFSFSIGKAFWMIKKGNWVINAMVPPAPLNAEQEAELPLHEGWNLITNPLLTPISWSLVQDSASTNEPLYAFENGSFSISETFKPFAGYYFFNATGASVVHIPSTGSSNSTQQVIGSKRGSIPPTQLETTDWQVKVVMQSGMVTDRALWFGTNQNARSDKDPLDVHKPRAMHSSPSVLFHRPEWDASYNTFASDIRPPLSTVERWEFEVRAPQGQLVKLSFHSLEDVPSKFGIWLVDAERGTSVDLRAKPFYRFLALEDVSTLAVLVGTSEAIREKLPSLIVPEGISLGANFPNPFNPSTSIPFELPTEMKVTVTIHNLLGQEVKKLFAGTLSAGQHRITWDGTSERGATVPSAIYFYKLTTDDGRKFIRSMLLIK